MHMHTAIFLLLQNAKMSQEANNLCPETLKQITQVLNIKRISNDCIKDDKRYYCLEWEPSWIAEKFVKILKPLLVEEYEKKDKPKLKEEKQGENHTGQNDKDDVITFPPLEGTNEFEESLIIETSPAQNTTHQTIPGSHIKNEDTATKSCNLYTENFHDSIGITTSQRKVKCTPRRSRQDIHQLFDCEFCGAQFVHKTHLRIHTRSHTGEKPHKCTFCGRGFAQKGNLRVHEKIHTGEKEYACQFCNKRFITNAQLLVHIRTHTNPNKKRPFSVGGGGYKDADTRDKVIKQGPGNSSNKDSAAILTGSNKNAILNSEFTSKDSITDSMNKLLGQLVSNGQNNKRTLNEPESISSVFVDRIARSKITTSVNSEPHMTVISQIGSNSPVVIERTNEIF
ncbi:uncharacterized protein [Clytia hemisphaerica]